MYTIFSSDAKYPHYVQAATNYIQSMGCGKQYPLNYTDISMHPTSWLSKNNPTAHQQLQGNKVAVYGVAKMARISLFRLHFCLKCSIRLHESTVFSFAKFM